jgi:uncharacterized protein
VFIVIDDLKPEPLHFHHEYPIGEIKFSHEDAVLRAPVAIDFILSHTDRNLHVDGTLETSLHCKCSRCTKDFSRLVKTGFDLSYAPQPKWSTGDAEIELRYEEMEVGFYDGVALDVNLMVLEQIELSIPMRLICKEDCKGLCYKCGADLNDGACFCKNEETDSRLSVLLDFKKKMDK